MSFIKVKRCLLIYFRKSSPGEKRDKPKMKPRITISRDYQDEEDRMFGAGDKGGSGDKDDRFMFGPPGGGLQLTGKNNNTDDMMDISTSP